MSRDQRRYREIYMSHFGYGEQDYVPSEISGLPMDHVHHIVWRSQGGTDDITNLIALTSKEHEQVHGLRKPFIAEKRLHKIHTRFLESRELLS